MVIGFIYKVVCFINDSIESTKVLHFSNGKKYFPKIIGKENTPGKNEISCDLVREYILREFWPFLHAESLGCPPLQFRPHVFESGDRWPLQNTVVAFTSPYLSGFWCMLGVIVFWTIYSTYDLAS